MLCAPAGNDILFDTKLCETGRNFCNKMWNAFRLVKGWEVSAEATQPEAARFAISWMKERLAQSTEEIADLFSKFRISEALREAYRLFWDDFSSWYLEMVKPAYGSPSDSATYNETLGIFDSLLRLLHPFMPFITEELWQHLTERRDGESIMYAQIEQPADRHPHEARLMETVKAAVNGLRNVRAEKNIPNKEPLTVNIIGSWDKAVDAPVMKLANASAVNHNATKDPAAATFMVGLTEINVPLLDSIDVEAETAKLEKDLKYYQGFKVSVEKKLGNERFVNNAPAAVVEGERKKLADAEAKIATITAALEAIRK